MILTDRALYSLGGRIAYEEIREVEDKGAGILTVRGYRSVYRLSGLTDSEGLAEGLRRRMEATSDRSD